MARLSALEEVTAKHAEVVTLNQEQMEEQEKLADLVKNMREAMQVVQMQTKRTEGNVGTMNQQWAQLVSRVDAIQQHQTQNPMGGDASGQGHSHQQRRGYLPEKATIPKTLADKYEEWRQWKEDVEDFLDTRTKGMKVFLQQVANDKDQGELTQLYKETQRIKIEEVGGNFHQVTQDDVQVWRALRDSPMERLER